MGNSRHGFLLLMGCLLAPGVACQHQAFINFHEVDIPHLEPLTGKMVDELHEHGLRVIAAMIENMRLVPLLWKFKVNFVQGFCMQKPSTSLEFEFLQDQTIN